MNWIQPEYLAFKRELDEKLVERRRYERQLAREKSATSEIHLRLSNLIAPYMSLIGYSYEEGIDLESLKDLAQNLPELSEINSHQDTIEPDLFEMNSLRHELRNKLSMIQSSISLYEDTTKQSQTFESSLRFLNAISPIQTDGAENCICPICRSRVESLSSEIHAITNAKSELEDELSKIGNYSIDSTEHYESLKKQRDSLKRQISSINQKIESLERISKDLLSEKSLEKKAYLLKGQIETSAKYYLGAINTLASDSDISELRERIDWLEEKLKGFDIDRIYAQAESQLSELMTSICNELDFESELRPGKLVLDLKNFDFYYHYDGKEKISLSEMGSGANWLACHLSIFLGLMKLIALNKNSSIPSILILDQPSQVYFPNAYGEIDGDGSVDDNIRQVKNIFRVLLSAIDDIAAEMKYLPQIIVMEHANEEEFRLYIRKQWKRDGEKFI